MDYLNNLLVGPLNKLKTAGIIIGSLCVGIIAVSSAALISHSIMSTESSSSTPNPILPLRLLRISSTTPNVTISHIVYDTLSTSDIKTIVNATNSSTELNWRYLWFNATVPINSSIVIDIELPLSLCTNLTIYKYYNNTFQPNKATNINSTSCSFSINITDDDFKGDLSYGARRRSEKEFKYQAILWGGYLFREGNLEVDPKFQSDHRRGLLESESKPVFKNNVAAFDRSGIIKLVDLVSQNFDTKHSPTQQALDGISDPNSQYSGMLYEDLVYGISHGSPGATQESLFLYKLKTPLGNNKNVRQQVMISDEDTFAIDKQSMSLSKVEPSIILSCIGDSLHNNTDAKYRILLVKNLAVDFNGYTLDGKNYNYILDYAVAYDSRTSCNVTTTPI